MDTQPAAGLKSETEHITKWNMTSAIRLYLARLGRAQSDSEVDKSQQGTPRPDTADTSAEYSTKAVWGSCKSARSNRKARVNRRNQSFQSARSRMDDQKESGSSWHLSNPFASRITMKKELEIIMEDVAVTKKVCQASRKTLNGLIQVEHITVLLALTVLIYFRLKQKEVRRSQYIKGLEITYRQNTRTWKR